MTSFHTGKDSHGAGYVISSGGPRILRISGVVGHESAAWLWTQLENSNTQVGAPLHYIFCINSNHQATSGPARAYYHTFHRMQQYIFRLRNTYLWNGEDSDCKEYHRRRAVSGEPKRGPNTSNSRQCTTDYADVGRMWRVRPYKMDNAVQRRTNWPSGLCCRYHP